MHVSALRCGLFGIVLKFYINRASCSASAVFPLLICDDSILLLPVFGADKLIDIVHLYLFSSCSGVLLFSFKVFILTSLSHSRLQLTSIRS